MCDLAGKILIVDDDKSHAKLLEKYVKQSSPNTTVDIAHSDLDALALITNRRYDLAFIDVCMPDTSGQELLKRIRGMENRPLYSVFISGSVFHNNELDGVSVIEKPIKYNVIDSALAETLTMANVITLNAEIRKINDWFKLRRESNGRFWQINR